MPPSVPPRRPGPLPMPLSRSLAARTAPAMPRPQAMVRRRPSLLRQLAVGIGAIGLFLSALPTALLLAFALLPSLVALLIDRHPKRYAVRCVAAFNLAGTWPYLVALWKGGHTLLLASQTLINPYAWLIIYGAAAIGWLCYLGLPAVVWAWMELFAGRRIAHLRRQQTKLVEDWGEDVAKAPLPPRL